MLTWTDGWVDAKLAVSDGSSAGKSDGDCGRAGSDERIDPDSVALEEPGSVVVVDVVEVVASGVPSPLGVTVPLPVLFVLALNTSRGKSPTAMAIVLISPTSALAIAEIGSQGCSSVLYSHGRYLHN